MTIGTGHKRDPGKNLKPFFVEALPTYENKFLSALYNSVLKRRDGRVVEGARLESVLGATLRRFESCSLRFETEGGILEMVSEVCRIIRYGAMSNDKANPLPSAIKKVIKLD